MSEQTVVVKASEVRAVSRLSYGELARRTLTVVAVCAAFALGLFLICYAIQVILLVFAAVLLAVLLRSLANRVDEVTHLGRGWSLAVVVIALLAVLALVGWLLAPGLARQADQMSQAFAKAGKELGQTAGQYEWGKRLMDPSNKASLLTGVADLWGGITGLFAASMSIIVGVVVVVVVGLFLAADPGLYVNGVVRLLAPPRRGRGKEVLEATGKRLAWWLVGRGISMAVVGVATGIGLGLLGIPLAPALGLMTGLLNFIPTFGPMLAAVPTALVALTVSPMDAVYAVALYTAVACLDGYAVTPLVQMRVSHLPPALLLVVQVLMGVLAGQFGLVVAAPFLVVVMVFVQMFYIEDVLEKPAVSHSPFPPPEEEKGGADGAAFAAQMR
jgi:predicted PurR-regulated permease PerM